MSSYKEKLVQRLTESKEMGLTYGQASDDVVTWHKQQEGTPEFREFNEFCGLSPNSDYLRTLDVLHQIIDENRGA